ncbi:DivIVA domain-containing protein [Streptomyces sp. NPDC014864]|uniref:DivIVA domain-containing protein n=1 Tax=Streptomyces sp. NPDC014864 TaxID=3364924 RepID=UPI00370171AB
MTVTPGVEPSPYPGSAARRNGDLPQGLKSAPHIPNPGYPHLGFNPVPGSTDTVHDLGRKLANCAKALEETHGLVTRLMDGSYWQGDAAVAFREQLDGGPLPLNLKNAAHSLRKAARQLDRWETELDDFQRRAKRLEEQAKEAQATVDAARGRAHRAKNSPDLHRKGADHDAAQKTLTHANTAVEEAQSDLDKIIAKARKLAEEHEDRARHRAAKIRDATKKLAPQEPGAWDKFTDWLDENLPDLLSGVAAILGVFALFATGPLAVPLLMLAAGVLSGSALVLRLQDDETWASLRDGITKGELDSDFWGNAISVAGDALGVVPGLGAVTKGLLKTPEVWSAAARSADEALTFGQKAAAVGSSIREEASAIDEAPSLLERVNVFGARTEDVLPKVETASTWLGAGTAVYGVAGSLYDTLDSDGAKTVTSVVDGVRTGAVDAPAAAGVLHFLFKGVAAAS